MSEFSEDYKHLATTQESLLKAKQHLDNASAILSGRVQPQSESIGAVLLTLASTLAIGFVLGCIVGGI